MVLNSGRKSGQLIALNLTLKLTSSYRQTEYGLPLKESFQYLIVIGHDIITCTSLCHYYIFKLGRGYQALLQLNMRIFPKISI